MILIYLCGNSVIILKYVRFDILAVLLLKIPDFWDMTLCYWASSFCHFKGTHAFIFRVFRVCLILKFKVLYSFKTSGTTQTMTRHLIPEDLDFL
jgi:hypothetical protein